MRRPQRLMRSSGSDRNIRTLRVASLSSGLSALAGIGGGGHAGSVTDRKPHEATAEADEVERFRSEYSDTTGCLLVLWTFGPSGDRGRGSRWERDRPQAP